jgi:hypothetical protein
MVTGAPHPVAAISMLAYVVGLRGRRIDAADVSIQPDQRGVTVADETDILTAVALAMATKAVEGLTEGGKAAFAALAKLVRERFKRRASAQTALTEAEADPSDESRIQYLRDELAQTAADDPEFDRELRRLWRDVSSHSTANTGGVVNTVSGSVAGNVVQARDVHGGISFGETSARRSDGTR